MAKIDTQAPSDPVATAASRAAEAAQALDIAQERDDHAEWLETSGRTGGVHSGLYTAKARDARLVARALRCYAAVLADDAEALVADALVATRHESAPAAVIEGARRVVAALLGAATPPPSMDAPSSTPSPTPAAAPTGEPE